MKILRFVLPLIPLGLIMPPVWAADEAAIQDLQSDVTVAKGKADKNADDINRLMGGLPGVEARVAALEAALSTADGAIGQLQTDLTAATAQIGEMQAQIDVLSAVDVSALENRVSIVEETLTCVTYDTTTMDLIFVGCNVHVRDGTGFTQSASGLGNLIVGYNANITGTLDRLGAHNVVLGDEQAYSGFGQLRAQFVGSSHDMTVAIGGSLSESISHDRSTAVGSDSTVIIGNGLTTSVGQDMSVTTGRDLIEAITGNRSTNIGKDSALVIGDNRSVSIVHNLTVQAGDQLILKSGPASTTMKKDGTIDIGGKDIRITGSGKIDIKAAGAVTVRGSTITHN